ncbi:unnamed protein product [Pieris macdunnoughi]|uniref:Uncharacterized protein n=1 Tax=Pieris macdunnoughi TaxID=345717 RepID=A0A821WRE8_9NEOP|nr:unnamed protein product [Pieris macdunnoughi]
MALLKLYFYSLTALLAVNLILADNSNETEQQEKASLFPGNFNPLDFFGQFLPFFGNRQTRDVSNQKDQEGQENQETTSESSNQRLTVSSAIVTCNYTETPGLSCVGCYQALSCGSGNIGRQRRCLLYCNSGRCSLVPGAQCLNATAAG